MELRFHSPTCLHSVYRDNFYHKECTNFHASVLMNLITAQYNFVSISCTNVYPNRTKERQKIGGWGESHLRPLVKYGFHRTCCHETHKCWTTLRADILYHISPLSVNNRGTCEHKFIDALKYSKVWLSMCRFSRNSTLR